MKNVVLCLHAEKIYDKISKNIKNSEIRYWRYSFMTNTYKVIDEKTWDRAMHCMVFRNSVEPAFCVTFDADVTIFLP